jgi:hypothetical protein
MYNADPLVLYTSKVPFRITTPLCTTRLFIAPLFTLCRIIDGLIISNYSGILRLFVIPGQHYGTPMAEKQKTESPKYYTLITKFSPHLGHAR